jgi:parallel beta-helix repeat protein
MGRTAQAFFLFFFFFQSMVLAQNATTPASLECIPNFNALSVYAYFTGDGNGDNSARLDFRKTGQPAWAQGHPLTRTAGGRYAGSIFSLAEGTDYDIRVTFSDPDGVQGGALTTGVRTRSGSFPSGSGRDWYVAPGGDDQGAGTEADPLATIQRAFDQAAPGDEIIVRPGVYRQSVDIAKSGTAAAYIHIRSETPRQAILDGSDPALAVIDGVDNWQPAGGQTFVTTLAYATGYVAVEGARLYHYSTLSDLQSQAAGVPGGWYFNPDGGRLYVLLPGGADPDTRVMQVGMLGEAFELTGARHIMIDGFTIRYYGSASARRGIYLNGASHNVVQSCLIHNCCYGIFVKLASAANNTFQDNEIYDTSIIGWPWGEVKGTDAEACGISLKGGAGNVVRRNMIRGFFDGIGISTWGDLNNETLNRDMDIHHNHIYEILDDPTEPEGACMNVRFWRNIVHTCQMGISLAPITVGPVFVVRETFYDFWRDAFKVSLDSSGRVYLYHNVAYTNRDATNALTSAGRWYNMVFKNNAIRSTHYVMEDFFSKPEGSIQMDYDNLYTTSVSRFVKWENIRYSDIEDFRQAKGLELHGLSRPPAFMDPANGDFHPGAGSPLIDAGVVIPNINDVYSGSAPDIGVYEYIDDDEPPIPPRNVRFFD